MNYHSVKWLLTLLPIITLVACNNTEETYMVGTLERDRWKSVLKATSLSLQSM